MKIKNLESLKATQYAVNFGKGTSFRFLTKKDGMGFTFTDTYVDENSEYELQYNHHLEACYIIAGEGEIHFDGNVERLEPGVFYALDQYDRHVIKSFSAIRMICVFSPALEGNEKHDFSKDGASGYGKS